MTITDHSDFAIQAGLNVNNLSITSTGSVTDAGDIDIDGALTVSTTGLIDLSGAGANDISGAVSLSGSAVTLSDTTATQIAGITSTGALSLTSGGPITQSGVIDADLTASFDAGNNAITLDNANDFSGAVSLSNTGANAVTIDDANDLELGTVSIAAGNLNIDNAGTITQSGALSVGGNLVLDNSDGEDADITLDNPSNAFTGTVSFVTDAGSDLDILDTTAFDLGALTANSLSVSAGGDITDSGALDIASTVSLLTTASNGSINLSEATDIDGVLSMTTHGTGTVSVTNLTDTIQLGAVTTAGLTLGAGGDITDSGVLDIGGDATFTTTAANGNLVLDSSSDIDGVLSVTTNGSGTASLTNLTGSIELGVISTESLTIDARGITQSGISSVTGTSSFSSGANVITLNQANNFTGAVSLSNTGANDVTIDDANDLVLGTVSIVAGNLNVDNAGTITQTGVISVGGNTVLDNSDGTNAGITLTNPSNIFAGTISIITGNESDVSLVDTTAIEIGALTLNSLTLSSGGDITDSGALDIATTASFTTTSGNGNVALDQAIDIDGALSISTHGSGTASVTNLTDDIDLGPITSASLTIESGGAITQSGAAIISGAVSVTNTNGDNDAIVLDHTNNSFGGTIALVTDIESAVTLSDTTAIELPSLTVASLTVTAGGEVSDSGTLAIAGATTINASGQNISLDETASTFGTISLSGANVALKEAEATDIGASTITGSFTLESTGEVSDSGTLSVTGASSISATGQDVTLDNESTSLGDLSVVAKNVYLVEDGAINASNITAETIQLSASEGISLNSTGENLQLAARSGTGGRKCCEYRCSCN